MEAVWGRRLIENDENLHPVIINVIPNIMLGKDKAERYCVQDKEEWAKDRALRHNTGLTDVMIAIQRHCLNVMFDDNYV